MNRVPEPESESTEPQSAAPPGQEDLLGRRIGTALIDLALLLALFAILAATIGESTVEGGSFDFSLDGAEAALYLALVLTRPAGPTATADWNFWTKLSRSFGASRSPVPISCGARATSGGLGVHTSSCWRRS